MEPSKAPNLRFKALSAYIHMTNDPTGHTTDTLYMSLQPWTEMPRHSLTALSPTYCMPTPKLQFQEPNSPQARNQYGF